MTEYHEPVLGEAVLECLGSMEEGTVLDATVGGGGHAWMILTKCPDCTILASDLDPDALEAARVRLARFADRVRLVQCRFDETLDIAGVPPASLAGALLDLGVSSHQLDLDERGFAFRRGVPLDMRLSGAEGGHPSAADLLNRESEERLTVVFREYGEQPRSHALAREIVRRRATRPFAISDDLVAALSAALGRSPSQKDKARVFQALRIAVNGELDALSSALPLIRDALRPGAVMVVLAYHSLEDRIVKNAFREWSKDCVCPPRLPVCACRGRPLGQPVTRSPIRPDEREVQANPRARSARLRAWRVAA
jgi:16S rRNA (cytosine1402-N4)-methyltransferase